MTDLFFGEVKDKSTVSFYKKRWFQLFSICINYWSHQLSIFCTFTVSQTSNNYAKESSKFFMLLNLLCAMDSFVLIPFIVTIFQGRIRRISILQFSDALTHIGIQLLNHLVTRLQNHCKDHTHQQHKTIEHYRLAQPHLMNISISDVTMMTKTHSIVHLLFSLQCNC